VPLRASASSQHATRHHELGEHETLCGLHREGMLAAQCPAGARDADKLAFGDAGLGTRIQVEDRTYGVTAAGVRLNR
jgi:hypothetical protein